LERYYELLGVKPGVSNAELKSAHRDMAKVWHPDRFTHDPRLQQKAQEKLKEINEAFDILSSAKIPRPQPQTRSEEDWSSTCSTRPRAYTETPIVRSKSKHSFRWEFAVLPMLLFFVVFGFTIRSLMRPATNNTQQAASEANTTSEPQPEHVTAKTDSSRGRKEIDAAGQPAPQAAPTTELRPMATTTVTIDPSTGLLARADCPTKTRMTYPSGSEPHEYCAAKHQQQPPEIATENNKTSRVKSLTKKAITRLSGETKQDDWSRQN
jgi:hypothetical protein